MCADPHTQGTWTQWHPWPSSQGVCRSAGRCLHRHFQHVTAPVCSPHMFQEDHHCPCPQKILNPLNYHRPVALTSSIMKCFERLVKTFITSSFPDSLSLYPILLLLVTSPLPVYISAYVYLYIFILPFIPSFYQSCTPASIVYFYLYYTVFLFLFYFSILMLYFTLYIFYSYILNFCTILYLLSSVRLLLDVCVVFFTHIFRPLLEGAWDLRISLSKTASM